MTLLFVHLRARRLASTVVLCAPFVTSACDDVGPRGVDESEQTRAGAGADFAVVSTRDLTVKVFDGFNRVVDGALGQRCIVPASGSATAADYRAGADEISTRIHLLRTREDLVEALDIEGAAKVKVGPIGGGGELGLSHELETTERTVAVLLRARHRYTVHSPERHELTADALAMLETDPRRFVRECGTDYVAGVAYGAEVSVLIQIQASSLRDKNTVEAKLEAQGIKAGPATIDANLGAAFEKALEGESVEVSVAVESRGFVPTTDLSVLGDLDADAFALAAAAVDELRASVLHDKCNDQGELGPGACDGQPARGYVANGSRASVPVGLTLFPFPRTSNFPGDADVVEELLAPIREADVAVDVLTAYTSLYDTMLGVWADEVGAMGLSDAPYDFALYDPSDEILESSSAEVDAIAATWRAAYEPDHGTEVSALRGIVHRCWSRAAFGDFSECQLGITQSAEGRSLLERLEEYGRERVRPIHYTFVDRPHGFYHVDGKCPGGWRSPTKAEVSRLWNAIEANPGMPTCTQTTPSLVTGTGAWYDDRAGDCPGDEGAWIERLPSGSFATGCYHDGGRFHDDMDLLVLCVPGAGVYGAGVPDL